MNRKIAFTALSLAIAFGGASGAMAAGKKHGDARAAYASATAGSVADPRHNQGGNHETWCDLDPQCNGWNAWLQDVNARKLGAGH
ncbi:MAG TPA: hypothetical protein VGN55_18160 [Xanthobacteraceae bacterium]|jgi:hypothetical protein